MEGVIKRAMGERHREPTWKEKRSSENGTSKRDGFKKYGSKLKHWKLGKTEAQLPPDSKLTTKKDRQSWVSGDRGKKESWIVCKKHPSGVAEPLRLTKKPCGPRSTSGAKRKK